MLTAGNELREITAGKSLDDYLSNRLLQLGVERCLITLGEAATVIIRDAPDLVLTFPELAQIKGLRNKVVHDYDDINVAVVWKAVSDFLPGFLGRLRSYIDSLLGHGSGDLIGGSS